VASLKDAAMQMREVVAAQAPVLDSISDRSEALNAKMHRMSRKL
jgi:hypothetical protein